VLLISRREMGIDLSDGGLIGYMQQINYWTSNVWHVKLLLG